MEILTSQYKEELLREKEGLPSEKIKEILDFVCFIKAKEAIDPTKAYFRTRKWQEMEREADKDKEKGDIIGNGSAENLLESLAG